MTDIPSVQSEAVRLPVQTVRHPLPNTEPLSAYLALSGHFGRDEVYLLESASGPARDCRYQFLGFGLLLSVAVSHNVVRVEGEPALRDAVLANVGPLLDAVDGELRLRSPRDLWQVLRAVRSTFDAPGSASRFEFGFLGYFGYDTAHYIEELPFVIDGVSGRPDVELQLYQGCVVADLTTGGAELLLHESSAWSPLDPGVITTLLAGAASAHPLPEIEIDLIPEAVVGDDTSREQYLANVERCMKHIAIGDIYQVQIGHELNITSPIDPLVVYQRLRTRNASPYMYLTTVEKHTVIGASPELFVRVEDGLVTMRPIAGTSPRGAEDDEVVAERLRTDPKELAEHAMLVDLCRNDIGRICQADTLAVPDKMVVESYSHVLHLVSTVTGEAEEDKDTFDIIAALFPAGTMTGTPKIRAMEIIEAVERTRRGLYAGALGLIDVGGYVNLALCIRTLIHNDGSYRTRSSAGIVADSVAEREWIETMAKSSAAYWAVTGKELL